MHPSMSIRTFSHTRKCTDSSAQLLVRPWQSRARARHVHVCRGAGGVGGGATLDEILGLRGGRSQGRLAAEPSSSLLTYRLRDAAQSNHSDTLYDLITKHCYFDIYVKSMSLVILISTSCVHQICLQTYGATLIPILIHVRMTL